MSRKGLSKMRACASGIALAGLAIPISVEAQTVTGNLATTGVNYGQGATAPYAGQASVQTIITAFGLASNNANNAAGSPGGSELDAAYGTVANGNLYLLFAGDFQNNGNVLQVFVQGGSGGQNTLEVPVAASAGATSGANLSNMNNSVFSPGFAPTMAVEVSVSGAAATVNTYSLSSAGASASTANNYPNAVSLTSGVGSNQNVDGNGTAVGITDTSASAQTADTGTAQGATISDALVGTSITTPSLYESVPGGIELGIPISLLAGTDPSQSFEVLAALNGSKDSGETNQDLPGLNIDNLGIKRAATYSATNAGGTTPPNDNPEYFTSTGGAGEGFTFASVPGQYFTVSVPEPTMLGTMVGALALGSLKRRRK
ncbi:MAG TPA: PEP-CTERM sorting domain-containing protein [Tepidisphaeraceae bacterium]|nr:PEP-CTERM sorting domain-containing protein [Tepidisphaeraceae bacterium]